MKKEKNIPYRLLLIFLVFLLALGIFLLIIGLKMGPAPLTMPWTIDV